MKLYIPGTPVRYSEWYVFDQSKFTRSSKGNERWHFGTTSLNRCDYYRWHHGQILKTMLLLIPMVFKV